MLVNFTKQTAPSLTNISSNADWGSFHNDEGRLATRASTASRLPVPRVQCAAKDIINGLGNHHGGRNIGLDVENGASVFQQSGERRINLGSVANVR